MFIFCARGAFAVLAPVLVAYNFARVQGGERSVQFLGCVYETPAC